MPAGNAPRGGIALAAILILRKWRTGEKSRAASSSGARSSAAQLVVVSSRVRARDSSRARLSQNASSAVPIPRPIACG